jgi:EAL domain-containing protein (putative c-di-GMP-specific phosphodiesterase class I)
VIHEDSQTTDFLEQILSHQEPFESKNQELILADLIGLIDNTEDLLWSVSLDHKLLAFNLAFRKSMLASYGVSVSPGMLFKELLPSSVADLWSTLAGETLATGRMRGGIPLFGSTALELCLNRIMTGGETSGVSVCARFVDSQAATQSVLMRTEDAGRILKDGPQQILPKQTATSDLTEDGSTNSLRSPLVLGERFQKEEELIRAIAKNELVLYYQPQMDRRKIIGAEALIRWNHPKRGLLSPAEFIPFAEQTGLILPIGNWVLETACAQLVKWAGQEISGKLTVSVNISAKQAAQPSFVEEVLAAVNKSGANPANLELELTENVLVSRFEDVARKMTALKSFGVQFSLDDFGTGYSSLSYLKRLPLDQLKIDRSFVRDLETDVNSGAIAQAIISLGQAMGLAVIAEGVENDEQLKFLIAMGCHAFQGYLISPPVALKDFEQLLSISSSDDARLPGG